MQDKELDALFDLAARHRPTPSSALMDRVLADALELQPASQPLAPPPMRKAGLLSRLAGLFGGPPVLAGVCSAALAGVALGYLDPTTMDLLTGGIAGGLTGSETLDLFPSTDFLATEG